MISVFLFKNTTVFAQGTPADLPDTSETSTNDVPVLPVAPKGSVNPKFKEAKQRFTQGVALAKAGNCEGAITELRKSYKLVERTNTLFNIAHCHEELFQYTLAIAAYERFLATATKDDPDLIRVKSTIESLRNLLGTLHIQSNVNAEVWLGDRHIGTAPGDVFIPGGRHVVELRSKGYIPTRKEISVAARENVSLDFELIIAQKNVTITKIKSRGLQPIFFWGGTAATGIAVLGGAFFGWRALDADNQANAIDPRLPRNDQKDRIKLYRNVADVFFLSAGALGIGTTVLYFMTEWKPNTETANQSSVGSFLRLRPSIGSTSWGLTLEGTL